MSAGLSAAAIERGVAEAGLKPLPDGVSGRFEAYFELLRKWNSRLNLTAIREPGEVLRRHFLECIFCAQALPSGVSTLLDYGSGAGFPGIPIALCREEIAVTLAESQGKKAAFLREAVRVLGLSAEVYAGRVEEMEAGRCFDAVALRAVDRMEGAVAEAARRGRLVAVLTVDGASLDFGPGFEVVSLRVATGGVLMLARRARG